MKKILLFLVTSAAILFSCSDNWDKHYDGNVNDDNVSPLTLKEYFDNEDSYSEFYALLKSAGVDGELNKNQFVTVWAVKNDNYDASEYENLSDTLLGAYHLCNLAFGTTELSSGLRILCMNGIYVTISEDEAGDFFVNKSQIVSSTRFKNGVVHEISSLMRPLTNMFEYIKTLNEDYSIIRDSIVYYNTKVFDQANSTPVGVDISGNTVYDSVFVDSNPLFDKVALNSEFEQFTMFLPSNEIITDFFDKMRSQYEMMGKTFTDDDYQLGINWIKETVFHKGAISDYHATVDLKSPFNATGALRVWRTSVQEVDELNTDELSNGIVYKVTKMKMPNNVLFTRIKSLVHYYEFLTDEQKAEYYIGKGINPDASGGGIESFGADTTPTGATYDGVTPVTRYWILRVHSFYPSDEEFSIEFPPLSYDPATNTASIMKVPPGEYNLYMGFQSSNHAYVDFFFQSGSEYMSDDLEPIRVEEQVQKSSPWNYDRVNETDPAISKWNGLGGLVGVINIEGDEMETFRLKVRFNKPYTTSVTYRQMRIYHWCLKPTENNY